MMAKLAIDRLDMKSTFISYTVNERSSQKMIIDLEKGIKISITVFFTSIFN